MNFRFAVPLILSAAAFAFLPAFSGMPRAHAEETVLVATGEGNAPENEKGTAKGNELAKRAALADAYRNMAKKLYGSGTFKKGDILVESVNGLVEGAKVTKEECKDGTCTVELTLTTNGIVALYGKTLSENKALSKKKGKDKKQDTALEDCKNMKTILQSEMDNIKSENKQLKKQVDDLKKQIAELKKKTP